MPQREVYCLGRAIGVVFAALMLAAGAGAGESAVAAGSGPGYQPRIGQQGKDVIWVPTQQSMVDLMLKMSEVTADDYLVDLGSGDGRTVISAAEQGVRAHGIEYNGDLVALSRSRAAQAGVADLATFEQADIFQSDFSQATVVTLFLLPRMNVRLIPTLLGMAPGTRVLSNSFLMGDWEPDEVLNAHADACQGFCTLYRWVVPADVSGTWQLAGGRLRLQQHFQHFSGEFQPASGGPALPVSEGVINGRLLRFQINGQAWEGEADSAVIEAVQPGGAKCIAARNTRELQQYGARLYNRQPLCNWLHAG